MINSVIHFKKLNYDLDNIIDNYLCQVQHYENFSKLHSDLLYWGVKNALHNAIPYNLLHTYGYTDCRRMFNIMYSCNCCENHQINKPTEEDFLNGFVPDYPYSNSTKKKCKCSCRHNCRMICREVNDEEWNDAFQSQLAEDWANAVDGMEYNPETGEWNDIEEEEEETESIS